MLRHFETIQASRALPSLRRVMDHVVLDQGEVASPFPVEFHVDGLLHV